MESIGKNQETYLVYNNTLCELDEAIIKLSIDDLYTFKSISEKLTNDIQTLGKIWSDKKAPKAMT
jgi:pantothenate kinase-related protein Tda10